jgi:hypothetical protein
VLAPAAMHSITPLHRALQVFRAMAAISQKDENFKIPASPDLVPEGPWKKVDGGVCAAKGFKATGGHVAALSQTIESNTQRRSILSVRPSLLHGAALHTTAASTTRKLTTCMFPSASPTASPLCTHP